MAQIWKIAAPNPWNMMASAYLNPAELTFLQQIKRELSLQSYQDVMKQVVSVLRALRETLTPQSARKLANCLPDFLKRPFIFNWKENSRHACVAHLDELVTLVMTRDKIQKDFIFKSEVQTLSVIILTLKNLLQLRGLEDFEGISPTLRHELDEVPPEAAIA